MQCFSVEVKKQIAETQMQRHKDSEEVIEESFGGYYGNILILDDVLFQSM